MHYLDESHILVFLVQLVLLLGMARTLGVACRAVKIPALAGEIVTGLLFGPTILGRFAPSLHGSLFPDEAIQSAMLDTVSWLGVFFLLLSVGFEVDLRKVTRQGKAAISIGIVGVVIPIAIGFPVFWQSSPEYWGPNTTQFGFALFVAVAGSITAISVVARVIRDLQATRTDLGSLTLSGCAVNDLFGWALFTVTVALATGASFDLGAAILTLFAVLVFVVVCLSIGSYVLRLAARRVRATRLPETPAMLTLVTSVGLVCGIVTHWLGVHAILGFFLAGAMVGSIEDEISPAQRESLSDTVHAVFVPIFFATIGIKIDFVSQLDLTFAALFTVVAIGGKLVGAWLGARIAGVSKPAATFVGIAFTPGGAMEIVVGMLALELGIVSRPTFVGIVFAALTSSVAVGPLLAWWHRRVPDGEAAAPGGRIRLG